MIVQSGALYIKLKELKADNFCIGEGNLALSVKIEYVHTKAIQYLEDQGFKVVRRYRDGIANFVVLRYTKEDNLEEVKENRFIKTGTRTLKIKPKVSKTTPKVDKARVLRKVRRTPEGD